MRLFLLSHLSWIRIRIFKAAGFGSAFRKTARSGSIALTPRQLTSTLRVHCTLYSVQYRSANLTDGLDDLDVGGEDDHQREHEAQEVEIEDEGDLYTMYPGYY